VAKRAGPRPTALAHHDRRLVEVDVLDAQSGELATAHPAVEEEPDHRVVAAVLEAGPGTGVEQLPQLGFPQHRWGSLGHVGRPHRRHRTAIDLALGREPLEELLERAEALRQGGRPHAGILAFDEEGLDVLPPHVGDPPRPSAARLSEERLELLDRLRIGHDRRRRLVLGPQVAGEQGQVVQSVRLGYRIKASPTTGARAHDYQGPSLRPWSQL
jgi:hypothetical protein